MTIEGGNYVAKILRLDFTNPQTRKADLLKWQIILRRCAAHNRLFTDYARGCKGQCGGFCDDLDPACQRAKTAVSSALLKPDTLLWEVWRKPSAPPAELDFVGILRLSEIHLGSDALAHFVFFDQRLKDKTELLQAWKEWVFKDHEGWPALKRVSLSVPSDSFALLKYAQKTLGATGDFDYEGVRVEGVKKDAWIADGEPKDVILMRVEA